MRDLLCPTEKAATPPPAHPLRGTCWQLGTSRYLICVVCDNLPAGIFGDFCLGTLEVLMECYYGGKSTGNFELVGADKIHMQSCTYHLEMEAKPIESCNRLMFCHSSISRMQSVFSM